MIAATHRLYALRRLSERSYCARKGFVLGVYKNSKSDEFHLTGAAKTIDGKSVGKLTETLKYLGAPNKHESLVLHNIHEDYRTLIICGLGQSVSTNSKQQDSRENRDLMKENARICGGIGAKAMQELKITDIVLDPCSCPRSISEGALLATYSFDELKSSENRKTSVTLRLFGDESELNIKEWSYGSIVAKGQNLARRLMELPGNRLTPSIFATISEELAEGVKNIDVEAFDKEWIVKQKMGAFLSVSQGSAEQPVFLKVSYNGCPDKKSQAMVLVGKGVTFDSGGISIKPSKSMDEMRGDMGGAATVFAAILSLARLKASVNVVGLIPLCENMPSGTAVKPGDVVVAANGKSIQVDNTDAEGRLLLADALSYAATLQPSAIVDVATLTGAIAVALGSGATGVYTNDDIIWSHLEKAGFETGDRMWRMPLWEHFAKQVKKSQLADLNNIGGERTGGSCTAAAFLGEFLEPGMPWAHLDIAGVMTSKADIAYLRPGMTGRPTRTLIQFVENYYESRQ